ncbi:MAG: hypothetical protein ACI9LT_003670, partial [Pseudoalteromonas distincta]
LDHRLGPQVAFLGNPGAQAAGQDDDFHRSTSPLPAAQAIRLTKASGQ